MFTSFKSTRVCCYDKNKGHGFLNYKILSGQIKLSESWQVLKLGKYKLSGTAKHDILHSYLFNTNQRADRVCEKPSAPLLFP